MSETSGRFGFSLFGGLLLLRRSNRPGEVLCAATVGYSAYRFIIEFFRDDPDCHTFNLALRDSQYTAIVVFLLSCAAWAWLRFRRIPAETAPVAPK